MNKKTVSITVVLISLLTSMNSTLAKEWFQGGTLQNSVLVEWQAADIANHISTAVSWISEQIGQDNYANVFARSEDLARVMAVMVVECVDSQIPYVVKMGFKLTEQKSQRVALLCMETFQDSQDGAWKDLY